jgi:hypothetical protein
MDSHDVNIVLEGNGALDIQKDGHVITYLQACKILVGLTPKEVIGFCKGPNNSNGEIIFLWGWINE